ncbi:MAG: proline dehydrogenase family protein [Candidatus Micrarchaeia archaeon]
MVGFAEKIIAGRWIAGPSINDAIERSRSFNKKDIGTILNYLGEELTDKGKIEDTIDTYRKLIKGIKAGKINSSISLKPTQLGLSLDYDLFKKNYTYILNQASGNGIFTWLDMEEREYIDDTIRAYINAIGKHKKMAGICIQANMKRSYADVKKIIANEGIIRLVKGAYSSPGFQYEDKESIDNNFIKLMNYIFLHSEKFMIATHDVRMISTARELNIKYKRDVTYAMLNGIRNKLAVELAKTDKVAVYVPFGREWVAYSYRRLKEAGHLSLILKSLLENQGI